MKKNAYLLSGDVIKAYETSEIRIWCTKSVSKSRALQKRGPGPGTRFRAGPQNKSGALRSTGGAVAVHPAGPLELSPALFPVKGPVFSEEGPGLNFVPRP